jgi:tripartite-type tricarboxylate transporter receptor subunit TctC
LLKPLLRGLWLGCALLAAAGANAQDWPSRPIRLIVPFLPGTSPDSSARALAEAMAPMFRQPIVVENKAGAAGNLGAQAAARSAPDGYTWVYAASTMAGAMRMYRKPGYDVLKDFALVGRISTADVVVVAPADSGLRTARDLIERARKEPGKLSFASGGIGTPAHLGAEMMLSVGHAQATHVPFKGASESLNAVIGRQVDFALTILSVSLPQVKAGKVTALAVTGPRRNAALPEVPTLAEQGLPGVDLTSFGGLAVPAGTPAPIVRRIGEALREALARPEIKAYLERLGVQPAPNSPEQFAEDMKVEIARTEKMMKAAKLEPQ